MEPLSFFGRATTLPLLALLGAILVASFYVGRSGKYVKMPSVIGYMVFGVLLGPSLCGLFNDAVQQQLSFISDIALGFVAVSIGLELNFAELKRLGGSIIWIIISESFGAFIIVTAALYLLTHDWVTSLIFGAIAPASAPAGTVAVIQEYRTRGSMTKALYAIVGFDDGLGIIIFGFCAAVARLLLQQQVGAAPDSMLLAMLEPVKEIALSFGIGLLGGALFSLLVRRLTRKEDIFILLVGFVMLGTGISNWLGVSLILTNMMMGILIVNTQGRTLLRDLQDPLAILMPLLFVLFFTLAGTSLQVRSLPALGVLGTVYVLTRSAGLIFGAQVGGFIGKAEKIIRNWVGLGILSQAGVAIGLSLVVKQRFRGLGPVVDVINGQNITYGDRLGSSVITTITATSIIFGIIGPFLTKLALEKAGEINKDTNRA